MKDCSGPGRIPCRARYRKRTRQEDGHLRADLVPDGKLRAEWEEPVYPAGLPEESKGRSFTGRKNFEIQLCNARRQLCRRSVTVLSYLNRKYVPVIVFEPGSPVGGAQQRLQDARQVHERVAHQQEHGQQRSEIVDVSDQYTALAHDHGYDQGSGRFAGRR